MTWTLPHHRWGTDRTNISLDILLDREIPEGPFFLKTSMSSFDLGYPTVQGKRARRKAMTFGFQKPHTGLFIRSRLTLVAM